MEPQWCFHPPQMLLTPSKAIDSIPLAEELKKRAEAVQFILRVGASLRLKMNVLSAAATYLHRFYMRYSIGPSGYDKIYMAAACLFVATKVEESTRKLKDVAHICFAKTVQEREIHPDDPRIQPWIQKILANEEILLEALCFDLIVEHPHEHLAEVLGGGTRDSLDHTIRGPLAAHASHRILELSWSVANDSLRIPLCLFYDSNVIACACYLLAYATDHTFATAIEEISTGLGYADQTNSQDSVPQIKMGSQFSEQPSQQSTCPDGTPPSTSSHSFVPLGTGPPEELVQSQASILDELLGDGESAGPWMHCFGITPDKTSQLADILGNLLDYYEEQNEKQVQEIRKIPRPSMYHPLKDRPAFSGAHISRAHSVTSNSSPANTLASNTTPLHGHMAEESGNSEFTSSLVRTNAGPGAPDDPSTSGHQEPALVESTRATHGTSHRNAKARGGEEDEIAMDLDD